MLLIIFIHVFEISMLQFFPYVVYQELGLNYDYCPLISLGAFTFKTLNFESQI